jgi:hypothetical protein
MIINVTITDNTSAEDGAMNTQLSLEEGSAPIRVLESQPAGQPIRILESQPALRIDTDPEFPKPSTGHIFDQGHGKSILTAAPQVYRRFMTNPAHNLRSTESFKNLLLTEEDQSPREVSIQQVPATAVLTPKRRLTKAAILDKQFRKSKEIYDKIFADYKID